MAEKKEFELEVKSNLDKVVKNVEQLSDSLDDVKQTADKTDKSLKHVEEDLKDIGKTGNQAANTLRKMGGAISGIASNIKGIGIGILASQFEDFKDALSSSNKVADAYSTSLNVVKKSAKDLGDSIFSGNFLKTAGNAIKNFVTNPAGTAAAAAIYINNAKKEAEDITKITNKALYAQVKQQGVFEKYDRQAEEQRKIRDNELETLENRNAANEKLATIIADQKREMLAYAQIQKDAAQAQFNLTGQREDEIKLEETKNNILGIRAQLQGFITEQDQARIALILEERQLLADTATTQRDIEFARKEALATTIKSEDENLIEQKRILDQKIHDTAQFFQQQEALYEKGSTRRKEIENAAEQEIAALRLQSISIADQLRTYQYNRDQELRMQVVNNELEAYSSRLFALQQFNQAAQESTQISEDEKRKISKDTLVQQKIIENQRIAMVSNTLGNISSLFEASSTEGKAFAIAQSLVNTYQGITAELATKTATPFEFGLKVANVATVAAMGFKAVQDIINTQPSTSGGGMDMSGATPASAAPQFNVVGASGINQVAQSLNQQANTPVKAYVVSKDVTTAQSLDRNIVNAASM